MIILVRVDPLQRDTFGSLCYKNRRLFLIDRLDRLEPQKLIPFLGTCSTHASGELIGDLADPEDLPSLLEIVLQRCVCLLLRPIDACNRLAPFCPKSAELVEVIYSRVDILVDLVV